MYDFAFSNLFSIKLIFELLQVSWVDLGTDVDWARRTVEQMEKVYFAHFSWLFLLPNF